MRKTIFANDEHYHIYNRGVDKREVFGNDADYVRFLKSLKEYNDINVYGRFNSRGLASKAPEAKPLVEIIAYCLNPNHYHLILKQVVEEGISKFMHKLSTSYTMYFNQKHNRSGSLFQGPFKSIHIDTNEYLLHLSAYVNRNDYIHGYNKIEESGDKSPIGDLAPDSWPYSSYLDYIGKRDGKLCNKEIILGQFKNKKDYADFVDRTGDYFKDKKDAEKYLLE